MALTKEVVREFSCSDGKHGALMLIDGRLAVSIRCKRHCYDSIYAKESHQRAYHYWFIDDPDERMFTDFEPATRTSNVSDSGIIM